MSQREYKGKEQKAAPSMYLDPQHSVQAAKRCKSKAATEKGCSVFELWGQYLVLQKAGVFRAESVEAFA